MCVIVQSIILCYCLQEGECSGCQLG